MADPRVDATSRDAPFLHHSLPSGSRPKATTQPSDAALAICRICRGEGTSAEPLFYPCKCSGSIKYVHQDCLMEWLSHSQKKYCELCKTSFRFTKLYAPDMPQSLPLHIFLEHMTRYLLRHLLVWLRGAVTISVWLLWLPYFMRSVWSFMFWISDEGLGSNPALFDTNDASGAPSWSTSLASTSAICPASPISLSDTAFINGGTSVSGYLDSDELPEQIVRVVLGFFGLSTRAIRSNITINFASTPSKSFLSDVDFLRNLTRSEALNRTIVSVIEGQIITILVIVCFILVILVRDYVVQQQPEMDARAAFEGPENVMPPQGQDEHEEPAAAAAAEAPALHDAGISGSDSEALDDETTLADVEFRRQPWLSDLEATAAESSVKNMAETVEKPLASRFSLEEPDSLDKPESSYGKDPHISQQLEPSVTADDSDQHTVADYLRIYRLAGGDVEKMMEIVRQEGLEEKLSYWIDVNRKLAYKQGKTGRNGLDPNLPRNSHPPSVEEDDLLAGSHLSAQSAHSEHLSNLSESESSSSKGKEKAFFSPVVESTNTSAPHDNSARARAVSDGSEVKTLANSLGSNTWSFTGVKSVNAPGSAEPQQTPDAAGMPESLTSQGDSAGAPSIHQAGLPGLNSQQQEQNDENNRQQQRTSSPLENNAAEEHVRGGGEPVGLVDRVAHFMWGGIDDYQNVNPEGEQQIGDDDSQPDAWVDVPMDEDTDDNAHDDAEELEGVAADPGLDPEAMEDLEDFEGVMELIGMRGPIAGLFQNAIFCAVLVSVTIFICIFIPYNVGRIAVWIIANPMQLIRMLFEFSRVVQDTAVVIGGLGSWCILNLVDLFTGVIGGDLGSKVVAARKASWLLWTTAGSRVMQHVLFDFPVSGSEMQNFSATSHEALIFIKSSIVAALYKAQEVLSSSSSSGFTAAVVSALSSTSKNVTALLSLLLEPSSWVIDLSGIVPRSPADSKLAYWPGIDRFWAILIGYSTIFAVGAMYLKRGRPFSRGNIMQAWEAGVIDTLHQASGIMKVILIISIEMLLFPLYCGLLLDVALLPLFENATVKSRMLFTCNYPMTSIFVHWFVGTGYMFHFALFVSMCRKIMRPGVLYFIRDPDDPEFHPVRDVLERNLTTQLRKILFSAFVYGALVMLCLGGVVWALFYTVPGVLPIHYSSNEPILEFPVDLLFYNFLMPLAVKLLKPSDRLHTMYTWWFRKCARGLRLTCFVFGERRVDEEGTLRLGASLGVHYPWYKSILLQLDENSTVVPTTWRNALENGTRPSSPLSSREERALRRKKQQLITSGQLVKDGLFVRAPASDRIKIPKGKQVLLPVSELGRRKDGKPDNDIYASAQYQTVYIPPSFKFRIFLFILFIWLFAAVSGVGLTVAPLILGRAVFSAFIPSAIRTNDIYAFSIGIYLLGSLAFLGWRSRRLLVRFKKWLGWTKGEIAVESRAMRFSYGFFNALKLLYAYSALFLLFPLFLSAMVELYITIPLHTYMNPPAAWTEGEPTQQLPQQDRGSHHHTIRVIQAWTLGLLYLNLGTKVLTTAFPNSHATAAVRTIMHRGLFRPNIGVLTRAFIVPGAVIAAVAVLGPPSIARILLKLGVLGSELRQIDRIGDSAEAAKLVTVYRHSYPAAVLATLAMKNAIGMARVFHGWKAGIRDEAYLIGERLHNFGAATGGARRARRAWEAGRPRL